MAPRFTEEEKGKQQVREEQSNRVRRIKAPCLNNEALIRDNSLTLIGRLTNPQEQKLSALSSHPVTPAEMEPTRACSGLRSGNQLFPVPF